MNTYESFTAGFARGYNLPAAKLEEYQQRNASSKDYKTIANQLKQKLLTHQPTLKEIFVYHAAELIGGVLSASLLGLSWLIQPGFERLLEKVEREERRNKEYIKYKKA